MPSCGGGGYTVLQIFEIEIFFIKIIKRQFELILFVQIGNVFPYFFFFGGGGVNVSGFFRTIIFTFMKRTYILNTQ